MGNAESIETLREKEREHNLEKISFFSDARKVQNILRRKRINMCIDKADYEKTLEKFKFLTFSDNLFFRWI